MEKLTQKEVKLYRRETLIAMLYKYEDMACNIDYIEEPFKSDIVQYNIELIKSRLLYKEF